MDARHRFLSPKDCFQFLVGFMTKTIYIFYGLLYGDISPTRYRVGGYKSGEKEVKVSLKNLPFTSEFAWRN